MSNTPTFEDDHPNPVTTAEDTPVLSPAPVPDEIKDSNPVAVADSPEQSMNDIVSGAVDAGTDALIGFDPAVHVMRDGAPVLNADGSFRRRPGRKSKSDVAAPGVADVPNAPPIPAQAATLTDNRAVALVLVSTVTTLAEKTIGPEWAAGKDEIKVLSDATRKYLDSIGGVEITPGAALCIAVAGYALPRIGHENTRSRLAKFGGWVADRYHWMRGKFGF